MPGILYRIPWNVIKDTMKEMETDTKEASNSWYKNTEKSQDSGAEVPNEQFRLPLS